MTSPRSALTRVLGGRFAPAAVAAVLAAAPLAAEVELRPSSLTPADVRLLPGRPVPAGVAPAGNPTAATAIPRGVAIAYDTGVDGWAGGGFSFDDSSTPSAEVADLRGVGSLRFGLRGAPARVKLELVDATDRKAVFYLAGVSADREAVYEVPATLFSSAIDAGRVRFIYFVIEGLHLAGRLEAYAAPPSDVAEVAPSPLSPRDIPALPDAGLVSVHGEGAPPVLSATPRGGAMRFDLSPRTWAAAGFSFDRPETAWADAVDLSTLPFLAVGLRGAPERVKLEVVDRAARRYVCHLTGVRADAERVYQVPLAPARAAVDLAAVQAVFFVVERTSGAGVLEFYRLPLRDVLPSAVLAPADLQALPGSPGTALAAPAGDAGRVSPLPRGLRFDYAAGPGGWAAAGFAFDDFASSAVETADLSGRASLRFSLCGTPGRVVMEVVDAADRKARVDLGGIPMGGEGIYDVPLGWFRNWVDLTRTRLVFFIVEGAGRSGRLDVLHRPPQTATVRASASPSALPSPALAPQSVLSPGLRDGINDAAVFGPEARSVVVTDMRGREVFRADGEGSMAWDARDASGAIVPPGAYAARVWTEDGRVLKQVFVVVR